MHPLGTPSTLTIGKSDAHRPLRVDDEGRLIALDYRTAVAKGLIPGARPFSGFGERVTAGAVANGIIWPNGAFYVPPEAGVQPSVVSTSANDAAAGTGIRTIDIHYIQAGTLAEMVEAVTLNGTTPVQMVATDVRFIQCKHALTVGSGGYAAGTISTTYSGNTISIISAGDIRCRSSARMVPGGKRAYVDGLVGGFSSATADAVGHMEIVATQLDEQQFTAEGLFFAHAEAALQDGSVTLPLHTPAPFDEGTIIAMAFTVDKAATVTATWFGWLENA